MLIALELRLTGHGPTKHAYLRRCYQIPAWLPVGVAINTAHRLEDGCGFLGVEVESSEVCLDTMSQQCQLSELTFDGDAELDVEVAALVNLGWVVDDEYTDY